MGERLLKSAEPGLHWCSIFLPPACPASQPVPDPSIIPPGQLGWHFLPWPQSLPKPAPRNIRPARPAHFCSIHSFSNSYRAPVLWSNCSKHWGYSREQKMNSDPTSNLRTNTDREFPGGPMLRTPAFTAKGLGSVPDWRTKII